MGISEIFIPKYLLKGTHKTIHLLEFVLWWDLAICSFSHLFIWGWEALLVVSEAPCSILGQIWDFLLQ